MDLATAMKNILFIVNVINQVISYWPSFRSLFGCICFWPWANTADLGPVNQPIWNHLINNIITLLRQKTRTNQFPEVIFKIFDMTSRQLKTDMSGKWKEHPVKMKCTWFWVRCQPITSKTHDLKSQSDFMLQKLSGRCLLQKTKKTKKKKKKKMAANKFASLNSEDLACLEKILTEKDLTHCILNKPKNLEHFIPFFFGLMFAFYAIVF